jgi:hypothetical protein
LPQRASAPFHPILDAFFLVNLPRFFLVDSAMSTLLSASSVIKCEALPPVKLPLLGAQFQCSTRNLGTVVFPGLFMLPTPLRRHFPADAPPFSPSAWFARRSRMVRPMSRCRHFPEVFVVRVVRNHKIGSYSLSD